MKFAADMAVSFITFFHILSILFCIIVYMAVCFVCFYLILCVLIMYFIAMFIYSFLFMFRSRYSVSLCCSVYCLCINVYCSTATGFQPNCS
jgi:hypothetical protein